LPLRRTIVVAEKSTDALAPPNVAGAMLAFNTVDQLVAEALMVTFTMMRTRRDSNSMTMSG
jgi:hypothetical protein